MHVLVIIGLKAVIVRGELTLGNRVKLDNSLLNRANSI